MILRVIRGRSDRATVRALRAELVAELGDGPGAMNGPDRYHVGIRSAGDAFDVLLLACWSSAEAAAEGDKRGISPLKLAARHLDNVDVGHFEIDMNLLREADIRPVAIRMATGRFTRPGGDIAMQDLLRQRLSTVEPAMIEAYVGRRLLGRGVDVTFVSAWRELPPDHPLDAPFWDDIAIHYDEFTVEVYGPVD